MKPDTTNFETGGWQKEILFALVLLAVIGFALAGSFGRPTVSCSGWGIDACLSCHVHPAEVPEHLALLKSSGIRWLRERNIHSPRAALEARDKGAALAGIGPKPRVQGTGSWKSQSTRILDTDRRRIWRTERHMGFHVLAFASTLRAVDREQEGNQLAENLLKVFQACRETALLTFGEVSAWEMHNEADTFYCSDLPDRLAASQKAVYLGLKAGGRPLKKSLPTEEYPIVLMGALAFPPGPWLQLAAENGLFDYTDALNIHHYGFAMDLGAVIAAHRANARAWVKERDLPVWVTEAGLNNIPRDDWRNSKARIQQAEYILECARQALNERVAVFMPFVLVWRGEAFAMTESSVDLYPAWERYAEFSLAHKLPGNPGDPIAVPPTSLSSVIAQWLPDNLSCTPDKISRSYWFDADEAGVLQPIEGEVRIYNLGDTPARVRVRADGPPAAGLVWLEENPLSASFEMEPQTLRSFPVEIPPAGSPGRPVSLRFVAETLDAGGRVGASSPLVFAVAPPPVEPAMTRSAPLSLTAVQGRRFSYVGGEAPCQVTDRGTPWLGLNGVRTVAGGSGTWEFKVREKNRDAVTPPMAIAALPQGLPVLDAGFLRVRATDEKGLPAFLRVDLVDASGQRFTIVENLGRNPPRDTGDAVLLGYADFHPWVFGRCVPGSRFDPAAIREIQLRFTGAESGKTFQVTLGSVASVE